MKKGLSNLISGAHQTYWFDDYLAKALTRDDYHSVPAENEFYPSSAGSCLRYIQLIRLGIVKGQKPDLALQRVFDNGNDVHSRYKRYIRSIGKLVSEETPTRIEVDGIVIRGRADLVIKAPDDVLYLCEVKSINNNRFSALVVSGKPVDENFLQWNVYSHGLSIPNGIILYENKDNQGVKFFVVRYDESKFRQVVDGFLEIKRCSDIGKLVDIPGTCPNPKYCIAKKVCK